MKIPLSRGMFAEVSEEDYESVSKLKWHVSANGRRFYATHRFGWKGKSVSMHRFILNPNTGDDVDHINGNGLDNRRSNLRTVTRTQNLQAFQQPRKNKTSRFRGVCWSRCDECWKAQIQVNKVNVQLGRYADEKLAAGAYNEAASRFFGKFAQLNML